MHDGVTMPKRRIERINHLIRQEISELLRQQVNDPRLASLISVTSVSTSEDLSQAKVYISALGDTIDKNEILKGFTAASGFLRREISHRLRLRHTPQLSFHFDDSIEHGARLLKLIEQVTSEDVEANDGH